MSRVSKFTDEQKLQIALDLLAGKLSHAEICRKYDISSTYAYKLKDRALDVLRSGIGRPAGKQLQHGRSQGWNLHDQQPRRDWRNVLDTDH